MGVWLLLKLGRRHGFNCAFYDYVYIHSTFPKRGDKKSFYLVIDDKSKYGVPSLLRVAQH